MCLWNNDDNYETRSLLSLYRNLHIIKLLLWKSTNFAKAFSHQLPSDEPACFLIVWLHWGWIRSKPGCCLLAVGVLPPDCRGAASRLLGYSLSGCWGAAPRLSQCCLLAVGVQLLRLSVCCLLAVGVLPPGCWGAISQPSGCGLPGCSNDEA